MDAVSGPAGPSAGEYKRFRGTFKGTRGGKSGKKRGTGLEKTAHRRYIKVSNMLRGGAVVARQAHNLKADSSILSPATKKIRRPRGRLYFFNEAARLHFTEPQAQLHIFTPFRLRRKLFGFASSILRCRPSPVGRAAQALRLCQVMSLKSSC